MTSGILLIDKPRGKTSFHLVAILRRLTGVRKIGHTGTLDPFATGVMVLLIGRDFTKMSDRFLSEDKEYEATVCLGKATDSYDIDGAQVSSSDIVPTLEQVETSLASFQGEVLQTPPMFSAKKVGGKKLYNLARQGIEIAREPVLVSLKTTLVHYEYPFLSLRVSCSKGTYIRSIAHDLGQMLGCGAHLTELRRIRSGLFHIDKCTKLEMLTPENVSQYLVS